MPDPSDVAPMIKADLAAARREWLAAAKNDSTKRLVREQSDFLLPSNDEGRVFDFHGLRHTCGAWLAMAGVHPKVIQTVMRHSTITLTMDTYGHLFPGQEADAVSHLGKLMNTPAEPLRATGTINANAAESDEAQRRAQQSGRESVRDDAIQCDKAEEPETQHNTRKALQIANLGDAVREDAAGCESAPSRTRTLNPLIKSQMLCQLS